MKFNNFFHLVGNVVGMSWGVSLDPDLSKFDNKDSVKCIVIISWSDIL